MDRWAPLQPSRPGAPSSSSSGGGVGSLSSILRATSLAPAGLGSSTSGHLPAVRLPPPRLGAWIGPLPESLHLLVIANLPVPDCARLAQVSRGFGRLVSSDAAWEGRWKALGVKEPAGEAGPGTTASANGGAAHRSARSISNAGAVKDAPASPASPSSVRTPPSRSPALPTEDEFGDFVDVPIPPPASSAAPAVSLLDFDSVPLPSRFGSSSAGGRKEGFFAFSPVKDTTAAAAPSMASNYLPPPSASRPPPKNEPFLAKYKAHHGAQLAILAPLLYSAAPPAPSQILSALFPNQANSDPAAQAAVLLALLRFLSSAVAPLSEWRAARQLVLQAADRFDALCLTLFSRADEEADEETMHAWAEAGWSIWEEASVDDKGRLRIEEWELGRTWIERREILYEIGGGGTWDPLKNIMTPPEVPSAQLNFTPMDAFVTHVLAALSTSGALATRVFPPASRVLQQFAERVVADVIGEAYVQPLLARARDAGASGGRGGGHGLFLRASAAVFAMVGRVVDVVVDAGRPQDADGSKVGPSVVGKAEIEQLLFAMFEFNMDEYLDEETEFVKDSMDGVCREWDVRLKNDSSKPPPTATGANGKPSPQATTFLASQNPDQVKRNVLSSFKDALLLPVTIIPRTAVYVVTAGSTAAVSGFSMLNPTKWSGSGTVTPAAAGAAAGASPLGKGTNGKSSEAVDQAMVFELGDEDDEAAAGSTQVAIPTAVIAEKTQAAMLAPPAPSQARTPSRSATPRPESESFESLQLLISLDVALELIQTDREALKRVETFGLYPGRIGTRVKETVEEVFILLLQALSNRHIAPGFRIATEQMRTYKPADHEEATSVAPLLQFFELVHIGDTIQSMVQVYFDKEMAPHIDRTDFLNGVVREKKRFENVLDEAVASGLNAGIEVLMGQVEHIIISRTRPREYYPVDGADLDLGPTRGCKEAIESLQMHCELLRGSTSKDVLEVFYQEVGIRLQNILQRHLKRQIISLQGGFQMIADLNAYHAFIASLKQQRVTDDFSNLKMIGHVYIVEDAKDLAQIVRDATRYGGTFRPEDVYEFIQRRADWKKIERTVDSAMYSLSIKEDCVIC